MKKLFILSAIILYSCSIKTVRYKSKTYEKPQTYTLFTAKVPAGFKRVEKFYNHSYEVFLIYKDSAIIFFSNDKWNGSYTNIQNRNESRLQDKIIFKKSLTDTVSISGEKNGKFWREDLLNDVIIGYKNVPSKRKEEFDKAIITIKR